MSVVPGAEDQAGPRSTALDSIKDRFVNKDILTLGETHMEMQA